MFNNLDPACCEDAGAVSHQQDRQGEPGPVCGRLGGSDQRPVCDGEGGERLLSGQDGQTRLPLPAQTGGTPLCKHTCSQALLILYVNN